MYKLKQLSISIALLGCFAVINNAGAGIKTPKLSKGEIQVAMTNEGQVNGFGVFNVPDRRNRREVIRNDYRKKYEKKVEDLVSNKRMVDKEDIKWIDRAIERRVLSVESLKKLIKYGLGEYVNYPIETILINDPKTLLRTAIVNSGPDNDMLKIVELLVSIGAKIDDNSLKAAEEDASPEVRKFILEKKAKQDKDEKYKSQMGQNLKNTKQKRFSDVTVL